MFRQKSPKVSRGLSLLAQLWLSSFSLPSVTVEGGVGFIPCKYFLQTLL
jgi:hypothetical protein